MRTIDACNDDGTASIEGYVVEPTEEQVPNWLGDQIGPERSAIVAAYLRQADVFGICIVRNLNVDASARGRGFGSQLFDDALEESGADVALLVSDAAETQEDGFVLQEFYERRDFEVAAETAAGPLMVWPPEVAEAIRQALASPAPSRGLP